MPRGFVFVVAAYMCVGVSCTSFDPDLLLDGDASDDSGADASSDASMEASVDASADATVDASVDASDASNDATQPDADPSPQCDTTGGGEIVGNNAWFRGTANQSCTTVCAGRGGYNDATLTYAGYAPSGSGTVLNCGAVAQAFINPLPQLSDTGNTSEGLGCVYRIVSTPRVFRYTNTATTAEADHPDFERFCACGNDCFPE